MRDQELRPPLWIGHVALETDRLAASAHFMRTIGMRPIHQGPEVAIFELRGGTHLGPDREARHHREGGPVRLDG